MKYYFGLLIWLCIVIILFITRCDKTCQKTKSITENLKKAQEQQMIYSWHVDRATEYLKKYQDEIKQATTAKVSQWKHEKQASAIYWSGLSFGNYAYAWWDEWLTWDISKMETTWLQVPNGIILHHSATPANNDYDKTLKAINRWHSKRVHWLQPKNWNTDYPEISYHYVIFPDWHIVNTRSDNIIWRATQENNNWVIHILLVGDFRTEKPTDLQYTSLNKQITTLQSKYVINSITGHWQEEWEATACPWPLFDYMKVDQIKKRTPVKDEKKEIKKRYSSVYVDEKPDSASDNASYAYNKCMDKVGSSEWYYWCKNMVLTFNSENRSRDPAVKWKLNSNWTQDFWICQLNNKYHSSFISSDSFKSATKQIDYCIEVWIDAKNKWKMPRAWFKHREDRWVNVSFQ